MATLAPGDLNHTRKTNEYPISDLCTASYKREITKIRPQLGESENGMDKSNLFSGMGDDQANDYQYLLLFDRSTFSMFHCCIRLTPVSLCTTIRATEEALNIE